MGRRQYGTGSVYERTDGRWAGTIEAGFTASGARRRITVTAKTEAEAKRKLKLKQREIAAGGTALKASTTVKAWAVEWLEITRREVRPKAHIVDRTAVHRWIIPTIGHKRLDRLTPADVRKFVDAIRGGDDARNSTARAYHGTLLRLLKAAVVEGYQVPPSVLLVKRPKPSVHDREALALPHALAVLQQASTLPHGSRWAAALLQGMRQGECLGLTWPEVGDDALRVSWQLQALPYLDPKDRGKGFRVPDAYEARHLIGAYHLVRPKSKKGWRVIPLVPWMSDALARWREVAPVSPHGLVWPALDGDPANPGMDRAEWYGLQGAAEIGHPAGRYYRLHEARNTTATLLLELGVDESVRTAIMGHSSIATTRGYETVDLSQTRRALDGVAERLELVASPAGTASAPGQ